MKGDFTMLFDSTVLAFIAAAILMILTPGNDNILVLRNTLTKGKLAGLVTSAGVMTGICIHTGMAALGLSVILARSAVAFESIKLIGAAYLVFLGIQSLRNAIKGNGRLSELADARQAKDRKKNLAGVYLQGALTNILNPKVAFFFLSFLPQFIRPEDPFVAKSLLLAAIFILLGGLWFIMLVPGINRLRVIVVRPKIKRAVEASSGAVLVGLGVRLAFERR
jgi:RhtB (resistance to homoserine/threonine) family protein